VLLTTDATAHAEINALRLACREQQDIALEGALVATTCEPCPMCMSALHWARVGEVVYGATIADATAGGFNELAIPATEIVRLGKSQVRLQSGVLADECRELFAEWQRRPDRRTY
jgi:tRNA(Arg) A34 adenosine deaminase TadA